MIFDQHDVDGATRILQHLGNLDTEVKSRFVDGMLEMVQQQLAQLEVGQTKPPVSTLGLTRPPKLINPTIIKDRCPGTLNFGADEDVLILMPKDEVCNGVMRIAGGRNVRVVGGHIKYIGPGHRGGDRAVIRYGFITDTIFFEGLDLDVKGVEMDAFGSFGPRNNINSPTKVYVQNSYIHGVNGRRATVHGDIMEVFSGVDLVAFENVSAFSGCAGLFLPRRPANRIPGSSRNTKLGPRNIRLYNVHLGIDTSIVGVEPGAEVKRLLYLHDSRVAGTNHGATHDWVTLDNVYVDSQSDWPFWKMVFPTPGSRGPNSILSDDGKSVTFPKKINIQGEVREGPPPGGTFVDPRTVGLNYLSPWGSDEWR